MSYMYIFYEGAPLWHATNSPPLLLRIKYTQQDFISREKKHTDMLLFAQKYDHERPREELQDI